LYRLFPAFPAGCSGFALLLLRAVLGFALLLQGASGLGDPGPEAASVFADLIEIAAGMLLLAGFMTPVVGVATAVCSMANWFFSSNSGQGYFDSKPALVFAATILVSVILLGPGAFSIDARVFGRREIIIPSPSQHPRP
jgi:uncharacterized membrane protein YphA (DoxX/SURF4 family)